jgi:hypothetical protein
LRALLKICLPTIYENCADFSVIPDPQVGIRPGNIAGKIFRFVE